MLLDSRSTHGEEVMMRIVFVHGACVKDGSWWWHRTGELLAAQGLASEAPALPARRVSRRMREDPGWPRTSPRSGTS